MVIIVSTQKRERYILENIITPWYSDQKFNISKSNIKNVNWMSLLNDSISITNLAIPGTHNSCSNEFVDKDFLNPIYYFLGQTQSWNINEQIISGIRYLDLRVGGDGNIYHGIAKTKNTFIEVLEIISNFLMKYKSEGFIIRIKFVKKYCKNKKYNICLIYSICKVIDKYQNFIFESKYYPTIGEIRGKMFLIIENFKYKNYMRWNNKTLTLQDYYDLNGLKRFEIEKKKNLVNEYLYKKTDKLIINHCSGVGQTAMSDIKYVSYIVNKEPYINKNYRGIIALDFPGEELITHIINQNLKLNLTK